MPEFFDAVEEARKEYNTCVSVHFFRRDPEPSSPSSDYKPELDKVIAERVCHPSLEASLIDGTED